MIRDQVGKEKAPLDKFLAINAPFVGITPPDMYLVVYGWEVAANSAGHTTLRRTNCFHDQGFDNQTLITNASVEDVIQNSFNAGYMADGYSFDRPNHQATLAMANSAQSVGPSAITRASHHSATAGNGSTGLQGPVQIAGNTCK